MHAYRKLHRSPAASSGSKRANLTASLRLPPYPRSRRRGCPLLTASAQRQRSLSVGAQSSVTRGRVGKAVGPGSRASTQVRGNPACTSACIAVLAAYSPKNSELLCLKIHDLRMCCGIPLVFTDEPTLHEEHKQHHLLRGLAADSDGLVCKNCINILCTRMVSCVDVRLAEVQRCFEQPIASHPNYELSSLANRPRAHACT